MTHSLSPGQAGLLGALGAGIFLVTFVVLGLSQPGYDHLRNTVSYLVVGEYGWIQTLNFLVLAAAVFCIGYGLSNSLSAQYRRTILSIFLVLSMCVVAVAVVPVGTTSSQERLQLQNLTTFGIIHHFFVLGIIVLMPLLLWPVVQGMMDRPLWRPYTRYTLFVLGFNFLGGILWYGLASSGYQSDWKGLLQKVLITNVLIWLMVIGVRLWRVETTPQ